MLFPEEPEPDLSEAIASYANLHKHLFEALASIQAANKQVKRMEKRDAGLGRLPLFVTATGIIYRQFTASWGEGTTAYLRAKVQRATKRDYQCVTSFY